MKKYFSYSIFLPALCAALILSGFIPDGDKEPINNSNYNYPAVVLGEQLDDPQYNMFESFENTAFPPSGWRKFNPLGGSGWNRQTIGTSPLPGWNSGVITSPNGGQSAVAYCTWNTGGQTSTDQWLVTPQILSINNLDSLSFYVKRPGFTGNYQDFVEIMISTTTPDMSSFYKVHTLFWAAGNGDTNWTRRSFKIADFPGVNVGSNIYIGFREKVSNNYEEGAAILLDLAEIETLTSIQQTNNQTPDDYKLSQNYPNPFNPTTNIDFSIVEKGYVSLKVFDVTGRLIANLVDNNLSPGSYTYGFDASSFNSGVYFYQLQTENFIETKKMMLVK
jgi:hypothetical protein